MELLLNLFWLLLTIPALWLWRKRGLRSEHENRSFLLLLSLGCLLALLFPVISASDDLSAMRIEAVDPVTSDSLRNSSAGRSTPAAHHQSAGFALPEMQFVATLGNPVWSAGISTPAPKAGLRLATIQVGRAPPLSSLEAR
jgi:hypothetical protein